MQLVLLGMNLSPILRSMILLKCINSDNFDCAEECELEFMEDLLGIETIDSSEDM